MGVCLFCVSFFILATDDNSAGKNTSKMILIKIKNHPSECDFKSNSKSLAKRKIKIKIAVYYSQNFSLAFAPIDPMNVPTKFEFRSFTRN